MSKKYFIRKKTVGNTNESLTTPTNTNAVLEETAVYNTSNTQKNRRIMTHNQMMSLNEMAQINLKEMDIDGKSSFNCNKYYVYVKGEGAYKKFPHFHIQCKAEGWDIRMNMDGTFHSVKSRGNRKNDDFTDIEKIAIEWVKKTNVLEKDRTNREAAEVAWARANN